MNIIAIPIYNKGKNQIITITEDFCILILFFEIID